MALSANARNLLGKVVALEDEGQVGEDGYVGARPLWEAAGLDAAEYEEAAEALWEKRLVEKGTSDYATLRATRRGRMLVSER